MAVGINLGTTYNYVGGWKNGGVAILPNDHDNRTIFFAVIIAKSLIGRSFADPIVQADIKVWPAKVQPVLVDFNQAWRFQPWWRCAAVVSTPSGFGIINFLILLEQ